jgi:hypothetical protein
MDGKPTHVVGDVDRLALLCIILRSAAVTWAVRAS